MNKPILEVDSLEVHYPIANGTAVAVNGVSFDVYKGETLGLVGESGCGKSTTAMAILNLVAAPGRIVGGSVRLNGKDFTRLDRKELRRARWRDVALIPQGAMDSLNPVIRIDKQIAEVIEEHEGKQKPRELEERIVTLLGLVGLPARVAKRFPHELSGGMKQRVCIAMAIALHPTLVVADEPTSALDVVVQRVVAETLLDVKKRVGVSMILIGHDIALQAQLVDRMAVMYAGSIIEIGPIEAIFDKPYHPYTQLLIASIPAIGQRRNPALGAPMKEVHHRPSGCVFRLRCPSAFDRCREEMPASRELSNGHVAACHLYADDGSLIEREVAAHV